MIRGSQSELKTRTSCFIAIQPPRHRNAGGDDNAIWKRDQVKEKENGSHLILRIQSMSAVLIKFFSFSGARSSSGGRFHSAHRLLPTYLYVYATPASAVEKQRHQLIIMTTWQGSTAIPHAIIDSLRMNQEHSFCLQKNVSPLFFESSLLQLLLCARD